MTRNRGEQSDVQAVGELVSALVRKIDEEKKITEEAVLGTWERVVGKRASQHTRPVALHRKKLKVEVENPGWIQELNFQKRSILKKLQSQFGKDLIEDIRFKTGDF